MSDWQLREVDPLGQEWAGFLCGTPHLVFHEAAWARVAHDGLDAEPVALFLDRAGQRAGGMIGCIIKVAGIRSLYLGLPYGGLLAEGPEGSGLAELLAEFSRPKGITRVVVSQFEGLGMPSYEGFQATELNTFLLDLGSRDTMADVRAAYKSQVRRNLRRAERSEVQIEVSNSGADLGTFYSLYLSSMRRNRAVPKYGREFVQAVGDHLLQSDRGALLLAKLSGEAIAGILVVDSDQGSHYLMGGSDSEALQYRPNELLFDAAIERSLTLNKAFFDFLPSGEGHDSLERFKLKWGSAPVAANSYQLVTRPIVHRLWQGARAVTETPLARTMLYRLRGR